MRRHSPDLGSASDWSCHMGNLRQPIRSTTQIWAVTRHQYGISALVSQTSFGGKATGSVAKCRLLSQTAIEVAKVTVEVTHAVLLSLLWDRILINLHIWGEFEKKNYKLF